MAELLFWIIVVPFALCSAWVFFVVRVGKLDQQDASALAAWRRVFRKIAVPGLDDTPEQARRRSERYALDAQAARHNQLITAIGVSSQIGRG